MDLLIVTGMSGAGKSTAMNALEDIGYFCPENIPPNFLNRLVEQGLRMEGYGAKMAVGIDSRSLQEYGDLQRALDRLRRKEIPFRILFLDAEDTVLLNRYKENRRSHPLIRNDIVSLEAAIREERRILLPTYENTTFLLDTSRLSITQLRQYIEDLFSIDSTKGLVVQSMSFGFKYGLPMESDLVFDARFLPNPFYEADLKEKTGLEAEVRDFVFRSDAAQTFLKKIKEILDFTYPYYQREGKKRLVVSVGCTGGKHRSVAFVQAIAGHLELQGVPVVVSHRDKNR